VKKTSVDHTSERIKMKAKTALISVSDKTGVAEFAAQLNELGIKIISSGGTCKKLKDEKIDCVELSDFTGFPEILDGRVKTLNPKIHGGILARRDNKAHLDELKKLKFEPIDIVVVNLYPFEKTLKKYSGKHDAASLNEIIENIDIGGVALLRAAAKNYNDVAVICDPEDYPKIVEMLKNGSLTTDEKKKLAAKAFRHTAYYDSVISGFFTEEKFPKEFAIGLRRAAGLRYGENPHQEASLYESTLNSGARTIAAAEQLQGKELSFNNYLDLEAGYNLINEFEEPACAILKHNNPCGCAEAGDILEAYQKALSCDPVSAFGGILAFNRDVDVKTAAEIIKTFTECIIAPGYAPEALQLFSGKKNLRVLKMPLKTKGENRAELDLRYLSGSVLLQDKDNKLSDELKPATKRKPADNELKSLLLALKICKHVKSNAIVLVRDRQAVGVGAGQMSRIDSLNIAVSKMREARTGLDESKYPLVLASDAFFPFNDVVKEAAKVGVTSIIQPGGSIRDKDSIEAADEAGMAMVFTGVRHFRH
jgi:phosphoribosylaminoimidazolecarboxamide formyltransferase / IMP cyclohydrolase